MPIHVTKHKIDQEWRSKISSRYKAVTKAFNSVFWESDRRLPTADMSDRMDVGRQ